MTASRVALVTGSARGMGRAMCEVLAASGHRVVGLDRLEQDRGPLERTVVADLTDPVRPGPGRRRHPGDRGSSRRARPQRRGARPRASAPRGHARGLRPPDLGQPARGVLPVAGRRRGDAPQRLGPDHRDLERRRADRRPVQLGDLRGDEDRRHQPDEELRPELRPPRDHGERHRAGRDRRVHDRAPDRRRARRRSPGSCRSAASPTRSRSPMSSTSSRRTERASSTARPSTSTAAGSWRERRAQAPARRHRRGCVGGLRPHPGLPAPTGGRAVDRQSPRPGGARGDPIPIRVRPRHHGLARGDRPAAGHRGADRAGRPSRGAGQGRARGGHPRPRREAVHHRSGGRLGDRPPRPRARPPRRPVLRLERDGHRRAGAPAHRGPGRHRRGGARDGRDGHDRPRPPDRGHDLPRRRRRAAPARARPGPTRRSRAAATARASSPTPSGW